MKKRFRVKRFLFETSLDEAVCRFMLTDRFFPLLVSKQYIEMKSVNKLATGKSRAYKLSVFSTSCMKSSERNMTQRQTDRCLLL